MNFMQPYLPLVSGESVASWLNRFGTLHCNLDLPDFMKLIGVPKQDLIMGRPTMLSRLSEISGVPTDDLKVATYQRVSDRVFSFHGELFFREFLLRNHVTFCPACLLSDFEENGNSMQFLVERIKWVFGPVRTCEVHDLPLHRERGSKVGGLALNRSQLALNPDHLRKLALTSGSRKPSPLQSYVDRRFAGEKGSTWLDMQQMDLGSRATEMLGACIEFGAHASLPKLTMDDWDTAGRVGFEFTSQGEEGIRKGLDYIYSRPQKNPAQCGPQGSFGKLYQWLQFRKNSKPLGPIKDVVREYVLDTFPLQPDTMLLGGLVERSRRHSVASLSTCFGVHAKTVEHALNKSGMLSQEDHLHDVRRTVPAEAAEKLIEKLKRAIPVAKIPSYIGCTRSQAALLLKAGIIYPVIPDSENASGRHKGVDSMDLDQLVEQMRQTGRNAERPCAGMVDVGQAANALGISSMDILKLLLKNQISDVELLSRELKFRSVLVNPQEVAFKLGSKTGQIGMTVSAAARELGVAAGAVHFLLRTKGRDGNPMLRTCGQVRHMGIMRAVVDRDSFELFKVHFRKLSHIEGYWSREPNRLRSELLARGVRPAWDPAIAEAEFYRVSEI